MELALRATSSTAALISLTAVAAISISSFCRASDRLPSSVTAFSCSAAAASSAAESPICSMVVQAGLHAAHGLHQLRRLVVAVAGDLAGQVAAAMRSAQDTAWRIGTTMLRVSSQAIVTLAARATSSTARIAVEAGVDIGGFGGGGAGGLAVEGDELLQGPLHLLVALQLGPAHQHAGFVGTVVTGQREQGGVSFEVLLLALDELVEQRALLVQDQQGAVFPPPWRG